jgi:SAM-dependent methyltransferase
MLGKLFAKLWRRVRYRLEPRPDAVFALRRPLSLPEGVSEVELRRFVLGIRPVGAPEAELARYAAEDFERFVHTWALVRDLTGDCLELGANPYFTTMLLRRFTPLRLTLANYFGPQVQTPLLEQQVAFEDGGKPAVLGLQTHHFNIERDRFPFPDAAFDVVTFCEIIEHLQTDPLAALGEIHRVLRPAGVLAVTTPNVARLENAARLVAGENIYDPYSGYGAYGRHNREYTLTELQRLLEHAGFAIEQAFTSDVHDNHAGWFVPLSQCRGLVKRERDLGQYLFVRARKRQTPHTKKPTWLYRSYPEGELE